MSFFNYVDKILVFFDHLPTITWKLFTLNLDKNGHFWITCQPHLVHVVNERPLRMKESKYEGKEFCSGLSLRAIFKYDRVHGHFFGTILSTMFGRISLRF
jgi:hypothetical protein